MVDHCLGVVFYPVIPAGSWAAITEFKLKRLAPVSHRVCVAVVEIIALEKRSGVGRIDISNDGSAVRAAQGTVTVVRPTTGVDVSAKVSIPLTALAARFARLRR